MKILLYTDNHFCEQSSIIRKHGLKYPARLENQINSINWAEQQALNNHCDIIICLGDFFDKYSLSDTEITALQDIHWAGLQHYFLVGNHESGRQSLEYSTTQVLQSDIRTVISEPTTIKHDNLELCFLPYITESERKPLTEYFGEKTECNRIILSHNDLKGLQMGPVVSRTGFELDDIEQHCDMFLNGHLHNGQVIRPKIINLGNLTGKDFGEDADRYSHNVMIYDTDTNTYDLIENPFAYNFYKLEFHAKKDISKLKKLKNNAVLSIKCDKSIIEDARTALAKQDNITEARLILQASSTADNAELDINDLRSTDHLQKLIECCHENIGSSEILDYELGEICK